MPDTSWRGRPVSPGSSVPRALAAVLLFHHAQGLTPGVRAFAGELRTAGHTVHTPDLFEDRAFQSIDEGLAYAKEVGFEDILERGVRMADDLPAELVYAGFSLGEMVARRQPQHLRRSGIHRGQPSHSQAGRDADRLLDADRCPERWARERVIDAARPTGRETSCRRDTRRPRRQKAVSAGARSRRS